MSEPRWQAQNQPTGDGSHTALPPGPGSVTPNLNKAPPQGPPPTGPWPTRFPPPGVPPWGPVNSHRPPVHQGSQRGFSHDVHVQPFPQEGSHPHLHHGPPLPHRPWHPFPQDGPRPPFPQIGHRPPFPHEGHRPPFPHEGPRPPFPQEGLQPPIPQEARPPFPQDGPRPSFRQDGLRAPFPHERHRPPFPHNGPRPPFPQEHPPSFPEKVHEVHEQSDGSHFPGFHPSSEHPASSKNPVHSGPGQNNGMPHSQTSRHQPSLETEIPSKNVTENDDDVKQNAADTKWVKNFTSKLCTAPKRPQVDDFPIYKAHSLLKEALMLKQELRSLIDTAQAEGSSLDSVHGSFVRIKSRLQAIEETFKDEDKLKCLQERCRRIKKKRTRLCGQRQEAREQMEEAKIQRLECHVNIDKWQTRLLEKEAEAKKAKELKDSADRILSEVTRKKTEGKRSQNLLKALTRLREVRKDKAQRKGMYIPPSSDEVFNQRLHYLEDVWQRQMETYDEEQRVLEVMMEVENEEIKEKEKEKARTKEERKLKEYKRNLMQYLFGKDVKHDPDDPMYGFRQFYESANHSPDNLVRIRQEWDMFLVPETRVGGSRLPRGWVLPPPPSDLAWASALKANQKQHR